MPVYIDKIVEKQVPYEIERVIERIVVQEVIKEVPVDKIVMQDVIKYVDRIVEKIVEVPVERIVIQEKPVEVVKGQFRLRSKKNDFDSESRLGTWNEEMSIKIKRGKSWIQNEERSVYIESV